MKGTSEQYICILCANFDRERFGDQREITFVSVIHL